MSGERWDVIVVGAGPAGSSAARAAAEAGSSVLLLDGARFPRYKTCGCGLIGTSLDLLPPAASEVVIDLLDLVWEAYRNEFRSVGEQAEGSM